MKKTQRQPNRISWKRLAGTSATLAFAAVMLSAVITTGSAQAQTFNTLYNFSGTDGAAVATAGLIQATDGNLYGATTGGGANSDGTVFKITPTGTLTTLHSFDGTDGASPWGRLVQATNGNFYGTTTGGGATNGYGTVFKITTSGTLTTLHSFDGTDGEAPYAGLVQATNGNFYGTEEDGGANLYGSVFKITGTDTLTTLHSFDSTDGANPQAALVQATDGNFYGTTRFGANSACNGGCGTVFKMTPTGMLTTLHSFDSTDGANPFGGMVQGTDGNLYGTTSAGGSANDGTVFKITLGGTLTTLHSFNVTDGATPYGVLIQATDGNFYGTTKNGGSTSCPGDCGTIFQITPGGALTTLHSFDGTDGEYPFAGLVQDTNGDLYGATGGGGAKNDGTVFSLSVGLSPFAVIRSSSGKEGAKIGILGQSFGSSSVVGFGGVAATTITLTGSTYISATVPAGALTGSVTVTTGATTLTSSQTFKVLPTITSIPASGSVGTPVAITGTGLTQATKVTFGGVKATSFTVNNDTQVTATVPTGAKTGKIAVITKGGSASSKTSFTVD
ncbi:MAG TPA: choice-of-anchor tandem repeat GloVer-containing protein [Candidatus Sulfotelmatobacter sp.]|nr:choice-of-anchor tandem repeat GloVer-containing protein [Candidatus Sulfotelmatobacter sp.]